MFQLNWNSSNDRERRIACRRNVSENRASPESIRRWNQSLRAKIFLPVGCSATYQWLFGEGTASSPGRSSPFRPSRIHLARMRVVHRHCMQENAGRRSAGSRKKHSRLPTLRDLLNPPEQRAQSFHRGYDVLDPVKVGFKEPPLRPTGPTGELIQAYFLFDTREKGNGNQGHAYGTQLSNEDKASLLEYLKTL